MVRTHLSFLQFYELCRKNGLRTGYRVIISLVARYADAPERYDQLLKLWSSLHDLTGEHVAFVFAGTYNEDLTVHRPYAWRNLGREYQAPEGLMIGNGENLLFDRDEMFGLGHSVHPEPPDRDELIGTHTLNIRELMTALNIRERDIPCLHFLYTYSNKIQVVPLDSLKGDIYRFFKQIMNEWDDLFDENRELKRQQRLAYEKEHKVRSKKGQVISLYNKLQTKVLTFDDDNMKAAAFDLLNTVKQASRNPDARKDAMFLFRNFRRKYPDGSTTDILSGFNTLIDLAPHLADADEPKENRQKVDSDLEERLIQTIPHILREPARQTELVKQWDVFIAHAGDDLVWAEDLYKYLCIDIKPFLDSRCLLPGDNWDVELPKAQRNSSITVVLISAATGYAYYVREEIALAIQLARNLDKKHKVIPIVLPGADMKNSVLYGLTRIHQITVNNRHDLYAASQSIIEAFKAIS